MLAIAARRSGGGGSRLLPQALHPLESFLLGDSEFQCPSGPSSSSAVRPCYDFGGAAAAAAAAAANAGRWQSSHTALCSQPFTSASCRLYGTTPRNSSSGSSAVEEVPPGSTTATPAQAPPLAPVAVTAAAVASRPAATTGTWLDRLPPAWVPYAQLMRLEKPIGTWLLAWPCFWSIALAAPPATPPSLHLLALFGAGAVLLRGAGCTVNDLWDRELDRRVERTRGRPLAAGTLAPWQAVGEWRG